jgi:hypothetical protein
MRFSHIRLVLCGFLSTATCFSGCDESSPPTSKSVEPPQAASAPKATGPEFTLTDPILDFGSINDFESRTVLVEFTNTGDSVLRVNSVQPTCGCTTTKLDQKNYAPGERGTINLTFKPKGSGPQTKYVKIHTNDSKPHDQVCRSTDRRIEATHFFAEGHLPWQAVHHLGDSRVG